jgi:predicted AAA+ superfamily ATPase
LGNEEISRRAADINGKVYLFFDEIQEVRDWEKCINSFRVSSDCDIYITGSNAKLLSGELATYLADVMWNLSSIPFLLQNFWSYTEQSFQMSLSRNVFKTIFCPAVCLTLPISAMLMNHQKPQHS